MYFRRQIKNLATFGSRTLGEIVIQAVIKIILQKDKAVIKKILQKDHSVLLLFTPTHTVKHAVKQHFGG